MKQSTQKISAPIEPDFLLIGIASHENDYRLAWAINSQLNLQLTKGKEIAVYHDKYAQTFTFPVFYQDIEDKGYALSLFANRGDNYFLLEDLKNIDFFLKLEGTISETRFRQIMDELKSIPIVMGVFNLEPKKLKKISRLIF